MQLTNVLVAYEDLAAEFVKGADGYVAVRKLTSNQPNGWRAKQVATSMFRAREENALRYGAHGDVLPITVV